MTGDVFLTGGIGWMLLAGIGGLALFGLTAILSSRRDHRRLNERKR